jgi:CheY-like chemotaxis protein
MIDVLVVEDDPHLLKLMKFALGLDSSFVVRGCGSAEEALEAVQTCAPAIVLLDLDLPRMSGREAAVAIGALAPDARIVFVTGSTRFEDVAVIRKPFDPLTLAAEVRRLAGEAPGAP